MKEIIEKLGKPFVQGILALVCVGAFTVAFLKGDVLPADFREIVLVIIAFFFGAASAK